jgi:hypothetical protein
MFGFVVATRAALAAGVGLLVANKISASRRRVLGLTLVSIGAATTIPAAIAVIAAARRQPPSFRHSADFTSSLTRLARRNPRSSV